MNTSKRKNSLTLSEQLELAFRDACREKNIEAQAYYSELMNTQGLTACASYEQYKGSWAHTVWRNKDSTKKLLELLTNVQTNRGSMFGAA